VKSTALLAGLLATMVSSTAFAAPKKKAPPPPPPPQEEEADTTYDEGSTSESGLEIGGHTGLSIPFGSVAKDLGTADLNKYIAVAIPFAFDIGYRINPHIFIGGFVHFAYAATSSEMCARVNGDCSSSGSQWKAGPQFRYTFTPEKRFSMWIGGGAAYEVVNLSLTQGTATRDDTVKGWEFIRADVGGDFHASRDFVIGPYASFSLGQYFSLDETQTGGNSTSSDFKNTALHQWLSFGMRLAYTF
jgi:opacity protein-like surface antigen